MIRFFIISMKDHTQYHKLLENFSISVETTYITTPTAAQNHTKRYVIRYVNV